MRGRNRSRVLGNPRESVLSGLNFRRHKYSLIIKKFNCGDFRPRFRPHFIGKYVGKYRAKLESLIGPSIDSNNQDPFPGFITRSSILENILWNWNWMQKKNITKLFYRLISENEVGIRNGFTQEIHSRYHYQLSSNNPTGAIFFKIDLDFRKMTHFVSWVDWIWTKINPLSIKFCRFLSKFLPLPQKTEQGQNKNFPIYSMNSLWWCQIDWFTALIY